MLPELPYELVQMVHPGHYLSVTGVGSWLPGETGELCGRQMLQLHAVTTAWLRTREGSTSFCLCLSLESEQAAVALRRDGRTDVPANRTALGLAQLKMKRWCRQVGCKRTNQNANTCLNTSHLTINVLCSVPAVAQGSCFAAKVSSAGNVIENNGRLFYSKSGWVTRNQLYFLPPPALSKDPLLWVLSPIT